MVDVVDVVDGFFAFWRFFFDFKEIYPRPLCRATEETDSAKVMPGATD